MVIQLNTSTSGTFTANDTQQDVVMLHEASLALTFTFAFPANPTNGQQVTMISTGGITTLSLSATVGTIVNALTGMTAGSPATYVYYSVTNKWYKIR